MDGRETVVSANAEPVSCHLLALDILKWLMKMPCSTIKTYLKFTVQATQDRQTQTLTNGEEQTLPY